MYYNKINNLLFHSIYIFAIGFYIFYLFYLLVFLFLILCLLFYFSIILLIFFFFFIDKGLGPSAGFFILIANY